MIDPLRVLRLPPDELVDGEAPESALTEFYFKTDPAEYFERRMWSIMAVAHLEDTEADLWMRDDPTSLYNQFRYIYGKDADFRTPPGSTLNQMTMASVESYSLMIHIVETVLRFYVAAKERRAGHSPVMPLVNLRSPNSLRKPVKELLTEEGFFAIPGRIFPPQLLSAVDDAEEARRHVKYIAQWLQFFAAFYSDSVFDGAQSNNQLKHGAVLIPRADYEISFVTLGDYEEVPEAPTLEDLERRQLVIGGHTVSYVTRQWLPDKNSQPGFSLRTDNSDPATNLAIAQVGISVLRSMWQIAKAAANPFTATEYDFNWSPLPEELLARTEWPPRAVEQILVEPRTEDSPAESSERSAT